MKKGFEKNISLRDFLHVLFKRKKQIIGFFYLSLACAIAGTLLTTPKYRATAQVLVNIGREYLYSSNRNDLRQFIPGNTMQQLNSELELIRSRALAAKVIAEVGMSSIFSTSTDIMGRLKKWILRQRKLEQIDEKAIDAFEKSLIARPVPNSNVIEICFIHWDADISAKVTNALANSYIDHHLNVHMPSQSYDFYDEQLKVLQNKLKRSEIELEKFKKEKGINALDEERTLLLRQYADVEYALKLATRQLAETRDRNKKLSEHLTMTPKNVTDRNETDPNLALISNLQEKLVDLEIRRNSLLIKYVPNSRHIKNVDEEIELVRAKLAKYEKKSYQRSSTGLNPIYARLKEQLLDGRTELQALRARQKALRRQLGEYRDRLSELNQVDAEFNRLTSDVALGRQNYNLYKGKVEQSRISKEMDAEKIANVRIIEYANPPHKPFSPKVLLNLLLGMGFGSLGGIAIAFFFEYFDDRIETVEDVEELLRLPVLSSIPDQNTLQSKL